MGWVVKLVGAGMLLGLMLGSGAAGKMGAAEAGRASAVSKDVFLYVRREGSVERTICVGDKVDVRARVLQVVETGDGKQFGFLFGVPLKASVADPSVGSISPEASVTGPGGDPLGEVRLTFTAAKVGTTKVRVEGRLINKQVLGVVLNSDTLTGEISVTVDKCEFRLDVTEVWHMEGGTVLIATITDAALAPTGDGQYAGNADVVYAASIAYPPPCHAVNHPPPGRAYITGQMVGSDLLEVTFEFERVAALTVTMVCPKENVDALGDVLMGSESMRILVLTSGGSARRHPHLEGPQTLDGTAAVTVWPVVGK